MAEGLSKGDKVSWRSGRGKASGTVERVITGRAKVGGRTVSGSKKDPRYVVKNAETGKTTVLKRSSMRKAAAARKAPTKEAAAAKEGKGAPKAPQPLRRPSRWPRWVAAAALVAAAAVAGIVLFGGDDDDDDDAGEAPLVTATAPTTTGPSEQTIQAVSAALEGEPLALRGVDAIPQQRLGDDQEQFASQFNRTYQRALADLDALQTATGETGTAGTADPAGGDEAQQLAAVTAYLQEELEIDRAITNAFVRNSFETGDSAIILGQKNARTEEALRRQLRRARALEAPAEAEDVQQAFLAARRANLDYLEDLEAAIAARDQSAFDQALSDGRAAATRAGRQLNRAASALQAQMESEFSAS